MDTSSLKLEQDRLEESDRRFNWVSRDPKGPRELFLEAKKG